LRSSENTKLDVTIPENAEPKITDNIVVTATSKANPSTSAENSCTAYSLALSKLHLLRGWNLIGFSLTSENTTPNNLFAGTTFTMYQWAAPYGPYSIPNKDLPVKDNIGYWVKENQDKTVTTSGVRPDNRTIYLVAGWNLVSFPLTSENTTPNKLFAGTTFTMYQWAAPYGPYSIPNKNLPVDDNRGYWVKVNEDTTITFSGVRQSSRTMYFVAGWNLSSFPLTSENTTPNKLFAGTTFTMYYWTGGGYGPVNKNLPVKDNIGYWVKENQIWSVTVPL